MATSPVSKQNDPSNDMTDAAFKKAIALTTKKQHPEAIQAYHEMLRTNPHHAPSWANIGSILRQQGHFEASIICTQRALRISPNTPSYLTNYGNCLADVDRMEEAIEAHATACRLKPDDFLIRYNYAICLREAGQFEKSLEHFDIACRMQPDNNNVLWDRALVYLYLGDFARGWDAFEIRWKIGQIQQRQTDMPQWKGEDLKGQTILIHAEQGFGDTILCARYIPLVKARGGRVVLECSKPLHRLFKTIEGLDRMIEPGKMDESYAYHVPMMSLPGIFGTRLDSIPPVPTLDTTQTMPAEAARVIALGEDKFKVGIVWSGSVTFRNNRKRAVDIDRFLPFAEVPGVQLYSLQKGPREGDLQACGGDNFIHPIGPMVNDFAETAAVLQHLDLVIMTDSSVAHLASSVGCPVWNLLHYRPYWLYLSDREDSPWYPFMRFIRQRAPGQWDGVFHQAREDLKTAVELKKQGKWPSMDLDSSQRRKIS